MRTKSEAYDNDFDRFLRTYEYSDNELSKVLGVADKTVGSLRANPENMKVWQIQKLARGLNVSEYFLFDIVSDNETEFLIESKDLESLSKNS